MPRIISIDYGKKRTGIATTDELQIIATPLETVETSKIFDFLDDFISKENVSDVVVGQPIRMHGEVGQLEVDILKFIEKFRKKYPAIKVHREDETLTSKMAAQAIYQSGAKKKKRRDKSLLDKVSASIILQSFLERKN